MHNRITASRFFFRELKRAVQVRIQFADIDTVQIDRCCTVTLPQISLRGCDLHGIILSDVQRVACRLRKAVRIGRKCGDNRLSVVFHDGDLCAFQCRIALDMSGSASAGNTGRSIAEIFDIELLDLHAALRRDLLIFHDDAVHIDGIVLECPALLSEFKGDGRCIAERLSFL